jgi:hypothetical protein
MTAPPNVFMRRFYQRSFTGGDAIVNDNCNSSAVVRLWSQTYGPGGGAVAGGKLRASEKVDHIFGVGAAEVEFLSVVENYQLVTVE